MTGWSAARRPPSASFLLHQRLRQAHDFPPGEVVVAFAIAGFMKFDAQKQTFVAWPSVAKLAVVTGLHERSVRRIIDRHIARPAPLFIGAGSIPVGKPRRLRRYALVVDAEAFEAGRGRAGCPIKTAEADRTPCPIKTADDTLTPGMASQIPGTLSDTPGTVYATAGAVPDEDTREETREETKKSERARGAARAAVSGSPSRTESIPWWDECKCIHGGGAIVCENGFSHFQRKLHEASA